MRKLFFILLLCQFVFAQDPRPVFQGQEPAREVSTVSRPIERQSRQTFTFEQDRVYFSNQFDGARLNTVERTGENSFTITIAPENAPVNHSPWYAFKIWSKKKKEVSVSLAYPEEFRHRYDPQISKDGKKWKLLEADRIEQFEKGTAEFGPNSKPKRITMRLGIGKKPSWVSAQELETSAKVFAWTDRLARKRKFSVETIGKSPEGRPIRLLKMCNAASKRMVMVISRQHPPEVTGYFAMRAFVETIAAKSKLTKQFCRDWGVYVVPLMNPDGVDNGHWRHNAGGIDLNRDWAAFNQPETQAVRDFLKRRETETGGKFYFGIDFHSTWDDIYYPMDQKHSGSIPGLMWEWLGKIKAGIPNYEPNIRPSANLHPTLVSRNYFLAAHGMEAIVFEIGDNTSREFIRKKGQVGAEELMKLLTEKQGTLTK